jgi:hypothetical protein
MKRFLPALLATAVAVAIPAAAFAANGPNYPNQSSQTQGGNHPGPGTNQPPPNQPPPNQGSQPNQGGPDSYHGDRNHDHDRNGRCEDDAYQQMSDELQHLSDIVRKGQYDGSYTKKSVRNFNREISEDRRSLDAYRADGCFDHREADEMRGRLRSLREKMRRYDSNPSRHGW